jgi:ribonuclease HI
MSLCEKELTGRAKHWIEKLKEEGFEAWIMEESLRDYSIRIELSRDERYYDPLTLWYSPRKKRYTPQFSNNIYNEELSALQRSWIKTEPDGGVSALDTEGYGLYVDGSFLNGKIGYGWVLINDNFKEAESYGQVDAQYASMRQVSGELTAVLEGLAYCRSKNIKNLKIYYDYEGIEAWAMRRWKTNRKLTAAYQSFFSKNRELSIQWMKVAAHSGNYWNEYADKLAKEGSKAFFATEPMALIS